MQDRESLLNADAAFVTGILFHSQSESGMGLFRIQKIGYFTYSNLPEPTKSNLEIEFDHCWMGKRDPYIDRILQWLVQSGFAVKKQGDVLSDGYTHEYKLTDKGEEAYTQLGSTGHVLTRKAEHRIDPDIVVEMNNMIKQISREWSGISTEHMINKALQQQENQDNPLRDMFTSSESSNE